MNWLYEITKYMKGNFYKSSTIKQDISDELSEAIKNAKPATPEELYQQRINFVTANLKLSSSQATEADVRREAMKLYSPKGNYD